LLEKLFIRNFAIIDRLEIDLPKGFTVLTGETGAGKSIIIDAVTVVTGGQGLTEFIRSGEEKAVVEAVFDIGVNAKAKKILEEYGLLPEEGDSLILTREIVKTGKNLCRVNGRQVNLSVLKDIAKTLVDIYGQHHQQSLLDPLKHIELLDDYGGDQMRGLRKKLSSAYRDIAALEARIREMEADEKERVRKIDIYKYQLEEIDGIGPVEGEDSSLEEEKNILANAERLSVLYNTAYELLYEGGRQKAVTDLLHEAASNLKEACSVDPAAGPLTETVESALYQLEEVARDIRKRCSSLETDPLKLDEVENRLALIRQLKKKYGDTINEILKYREEVASSLIVLDNFDEELSRTKKFMEEAKKHYDSIAGETSSQRRKTADTIRELITRELIELNMPHVTFDISITSGNRPTENGYDEVEFLISPNLGEPLKPLAKIVSGGEVSRIMLAFKKILAKIDSVFTLIFDEVDAGIGGNAIQAVAQKLSSIGTDRQVICVTHSPQIAARADNHFIITKETGESRTFTKIYGLSPEERIDEIARMLGGGKITAVTRKHAEEILKEKDTLNLLF